MSPGLTTAGLSALGRHVGLDLAAAVPIGPTPTWEAYRRWLNQGHAAGMSYLARENAIRKRRDPRELMPTARSVLVVGATYAGPPHRTLPQLDAPPLHGRVSRYAWNLQDVAAPDYHIWVRRRLEALVQRIEEHLQRPIDRRVFVDTGPILERAWATKAGLGWTGKNTCLIHPRLGSYLFLGVALLDVELPSEPSPRMPSCGTCTRCIDACPTGALVAPGVLDARRCLSYLTIEHRGPIPEAYRSAVGTRVFGCDTCQEVCPWNQRPLADHEAVAAPSLATLWLPGLLALSTEAFQQRFGQTAIWRAKPAGLARNAAIVLGNLGDPAGRSSLEGAASNHASDDVRDTARWALTKLG